MHLRLFGLFVGSLLIGSPGLAQTPVPLTIENIQTRNRGASDVVLSPDGKWIAVTGGGHCFDSSISFLGSKILPCFTIL